MGKIEILITGDAASGKSYFTKFVQTEFPKYSKDKVSIKATLDDRLLANRIVIRRLKTK